MATWARAPLSGLSRPGKAGHLPAPPHCARHRGQAGEARALRLGACSLRGGQGTKQVLSGNRLCPCVPAMWPRELLTTVTLPS